MIFELDFMGWFLVFAVIGGLIYKFMSDPVKDPELIRLNKRLKLDTGNLKLIKRAVKELPEQLMPGEEIELGVQGSHSNNNGLLCLTSKRVIYIDKTITGSLTVKDWMFNKIISVELDLGAMLGGISIITPGETFKFKNADKIRVKEISGLIKQHINEINEAHHAPQTPASPLPRKNIPKKTKISVNAASFIIPQSALGTLPTKTETAEGSNGEKYKVNVSILSCTCPDFIKRRKQFPAGDVRRICKHQARIISRKQKFFKEIENGAVFHLIKSASYSRKGVLIYKKILSVEGFTEIKGPDQFYMAFKPESDWAAVIIPNGDGAASADYSTSEHRWGRHSNPFPGGSRKAYNMIVKKIALANAMS